MIDKILCFFGLHYWLYRYKNGVFLHTFVGEPDLRDFVVNWTERKCECCDKREKSNERPSEV